MSKSLIDRYIKTSGSVNMTGFYYVRTNSFCVRTNKEIN